MTTDQSPTVHRIPMSATEPDRAITYGVAFVSTYVYRTSKSSYPTRVEVWFNLTRLNKRNGEPVKYGPYGKIDGGEGRFLDPSNNATDDMVSFLLSTESISVTASRDGTGHPNSGQVWSPDGEVIRDGDRLVLVFGERGEQEFAVEWTGNGHGRLVVIPV